MTLGWMRRLAMEGSKDLEVRSAAVEALDRYGAPAHAPLAALGAIYRYIQDRIRFVPDPVGAQMVQSPRATLDFRAGNCAQRATLLASMARSVGVPADLRYRVAALNPRFPRSFSHVYVVANVRGRELALDPTYPDARPGFEHPRPYRVGDFPVYQRMNPCRGPGCYAVVDPTLGGVFSFLKKVVKPAALFATKFLPGGVIVSTAAKLAISKVGGGGAGRPRAFGFSSRALASRLAAIRAAAATPMTQAAPMVAASMVAAAPTASPIPESQVAEAAAAEAAAPAGAMPMAPMLLIGGALLLLPLLRKGRR